MKLISDLEKTEYSKVLDDLHDTFKRGVTYYLERDILTLSTDPNYNYIYGETQAGVTSTTQIASGTFNARVQYLNFADFRSNLSHPINEMPVASDNTFARVKVDAEGKILLEEAKEIHIDGMKFERASPVRPHGLFSPQYYSFLLKSLK